MGRRTSDVQAAEEIGIRTYTVKVQYLPSGNTDRSINVPKNATDDEETH